MLVLTITYTIYELYAGTRSCAICTGTGWYIMKHFNKIFNNFLTIKFLIIKILKI